MIRYFYISKDIETIEKFQNQLESRGFRENQFHVLSTEDAEIDKRQLNPVPELEKKDAISLTLKGAVIGLVCAVLILLISYTFGWTDTQLGWVPFYFLAIVALGFCAWEGGFIGIQQRNSKFRRFEKALEQGKHVLLVDTGPEQKAVLAQMVNQTPALVYAGSGGVPYERIFSQQ